MNQKKECSFVGLPEKRKLDLFCRILSLEFYDSKSTIFAQKSKNGKNFPKNKPVNL